MKKKTIKADNWKRKDFEKIKEEINSIIAMVAKVDKSEIKESTNFREDLDIESLSAMEILAAIETWFGITIEAAQAFNIVTVKDLYEITKSYLLKKRMRASK